MQKKNEKAYEKTVWKDRETIISANLLNKIENQLVVLDTNVVDLDSQVKNVEHENEKQNFYINALYNENINGRLTIEGEGNSLKLTNSKKGIAEIETVVGNTFVNRVSESMRELILNGDIDTQGVSVTTTEGVDNGLIDVICEGNTLVNLSDSDNFKKQLVTMNGCKFHIIKDQLNYAYLTIPLDKMHLFKSNGKYKVIVNITKNTLVEKGGTQEAFVLPTYNYANDAIETSTDGNYSLRYKIGEVGVKECIITMKDFTNPSNPIRDHVMRFQSSFYATSGELEGYMIICEYNENQIYPTQPFEGMKSVGECTDGNHQIEIVSKNKNLFNKDLLKPVKGTTYGFYKFNPKGKQMTLSVTEKDPSIDITGLYIGFTGAGKDSYKEALWAVADNVIHKQQGCNLEYISFCPNNQSTLDKLFARFDFQLEEGQANPSYTPHASNKKNFLLNEPLRRIPGVTKDRFVKIDGKWFIKRNCKEIVLDGGLTDGLAYAIGNSHIDGMTSIVIKSYTEVLNKVRPSSVKVLTDRLPSDPNIHYNELIRPSLYQWTDNTAFLVGALKTDMLESNNEQGVINWFQKNPTTVIFEGAAPVYEPLEITPELVCYNEVTHISNNSLIPCNMTVKNTGFSCMSLAKNGTYTVTHNGGEGVNSNVDTTDNMVRLYGKSKTVSDVMVLDGRVSQASESFEGMKSTFEDKLVTQEMIDSGEEKAENLGKYKVNIKVIGKNLKNLNTVNQDWGHGLFNTTISQNNLNYHSCETFDVSDLRGKTIYRGIFRNGKLCDATFFVCIFDKDKKQIGNRYELRHFEGYKVPDNAYYMRFMFNCGNHNSLEAVKTDKYAITTEPFTAGETYEPYKEYTTSVYLNSPLLKDDEIVLKEDGLYHYHKSTSIRISLDNGFYASDIPRDQGVYIQIENKHLEKRFDTSKNHDSKFTCCNKFKTLPNSGLHNFDQEPCIGITSDNFIRLILRYKTMGLTNYNNDSIREWLRDNPIDLIYPLLTPYYEKISNEKLILEISNNATLHIDSIIPCKNIKANYTGNLPSVYKLENDISIIENHNIDIIATTFDMDYRLLELRWMLEDSGIAGVDLLGTLNSSESKNKTLSRYEQAKIIIIGKAYDKETLTKQLARYLEKEIITKTEYNKLIALMEINE